MKDPQGPPGQELAQGQQEQAPQQTHDGGGVDGLAQGLAVFGAVVPGHQHVDAGAHADEKAGVQAHQSGGGAHGAQRAGAREPAHHGHIGHIKKDLQHVGQHEGQAEHQDLLP